MREDGLKKLGYPTTNGETLHIDHEKYPWICSDVISPKKQIASGEFWGAWKDSRMELYLISSEGILQVRFSTFTTKSRQIVNSGSAMARNSYRKKQLLSSKTTGNRGGDVLEQPNRLTPLQQNVIQKDRWLRSAFWRLFFGKWLFQIHRPPIHLILGKGKASHWQLPKHLTARMLWTKFWKIVFLKKTKRQRFSLGVSPAH